MCYVLKFKICLIIKKVSHINKKLKLKDYLKHIT